MLFFIVLWCCTLLDSRVVHLVCLWKEKHSLDFFGKRIVFFRSHGGLAPFWRLALQCPSLLDNFKRNVFLGGRSCGENGSFRKRSEWRAKAGQVGGRFRCSWMQVAMLRSVSFVFHLCFRMIVLCWIRQQAWFEVFSQFRKRRISEHGGFFYTISYLFRCSFGANVIQSTFMLRRFRETLTSLKCVNRNLFC